MVGRITPEAAGWMDLGHPQPSVVQHIMTVFLYHWHQPSELRFLGGGKALDAHMGGVVSAKCHYSDLSGNRELNSIVQKLYRQETDHTGTLQHPVPDLQDLHL